MHRLIRGGSSAARTRRFATLMLLLVACAVAVGAGRAGAASAQPCVTCGGPLPPPPTRPSISPALSIDIASQTVARDGVRIAGWTADGDSPLAPLTVKISIDNGPVTTVTANLSRPDVAAAFPQYGPSHGYDLVIPAGPSPHQVCVTAVNVGSGADSTACQAVDDIVEFDAGEISYDTARARITASHLEELDTVTDPNRTSVQQSTTLSGQKTETDTEGWSDTLGLKVTVSGGVQIPLVANGSVSVEGSATFTQNGSTSTAHQFTWQQPVLVPPESEVVATIAVTESTLTVPYTLTGSYVYQSGARVAGSVGGTYTGTNSHDLEVRFDQLNLDGTPAARPVQQPQATVLQG